jgi:hypothetical protein
MNTGDDTGAAANGAAQSAQISYSLTADTSGKNTVASIGQGAQVTGGTSDASGDINVTATETDAIDTQVGAFAVGSLAAGGAVSIVNFGGMADAHVDAGAVLSTADDINVTATLDNNGTNLLAAGGSVGLVGLGAQVAIVNDASGQTAYLGNAASVAAGVQVNHADALTVDAAATRNFDLQAKGASIGGLAAGAAAGKLTITGGTTAYIGDYARIGGSDAASPTVNSVSVGAASAINATTDVLAAAAGILSGNGTDSDNTVNAPV